jgi:phytanoyl-CoA hydroxylase
MPSRLPPAVMPETPPSPEEAIRLLDEQGFACLGRLADDATLEALRVRADEIMLGKVVHEGLFFQLDSKTGTYEDLRFGDGWEGPSLSYRKIEKLEKDPVFRPWIESPLVEPYVRKRIDGDITLYRAALFGKAARGGTPLPWHQDGGAFWGLTKDPDIQVWLAIDDAPIEAGCMEIVPGSQHGGLVRPMGGMVPKDKADAARAEERAVALPAKAGDVILVHNYAWHRSGINQTDRPRRGLTSCYLPASTKCLRKKRAPREFAPMFRR